MKKQYDIIYIGTGTANVFGVINLFLNNPNKKILMIEKGKNPLNRKSNEVMNGWFGAGMFSDAKIILSDEVGGSINNILNKDQILKIENKLLEIISKFYNHKFNIIHPKIEDINQYKPFELIINDVLHLGTDYGREMGKIIYEHLLEYENLEILFKEEVINIEYKQNQYNIITDKNSYQSKKIVYATGKSGIKLTEKIINNFKLKTKYKNPQMGVRVEVPYGLTKELTDKYYDFKLKLSIPVIGNVRSFCVNPQGEIIKEENYGDITFNGGSNKEKKTNKTNFGIMCELKGMDIDVFEYQRKYVKTFNKNLGGTILKWKDLWSGDEKYWGDFLDIYNLILLWCMEFEKLCSGFLNEVKFYLPEVKYSTQMIDINNNFEVEGLPGFYVVGDSSISRGIYQSALSGIYVSEII